MPHLIFEKRAGKSSRLIRERNGVVEKLDAPSQAPILHDMFHAAVEGVLARRGFAHRYADGEGVGYRMDALAGSESVERLVEVMQADSWSGRPDPEEVIDLFKVTCAARGDASFDITRDEIIAIRARIDQLTAQWADTPVGGTLHVEI